MPFYSVFSEIKLRNFLFPSFLSVAEGKEPMGIHVGLGLLFIGVGGGAFYYAWRIRTKAEDSALCWPSVPGKIHKSTLVLESSGGGNQTPKKTYKAVVEYKYKVASRFYTHNKICIGGQLQMGFKKRAESHCQNYPYGAEVDVYYDPNNPQDSVLETREEVSGFYQMVGCVFLFIGGVVYLGLFP